jgi:hypothetical protein
MKESLNPAFDYTMNIIFLKKQIWDARTMVYIFNRRIRSGSLIKLLPGLSIVVLSRQKSWKITFGWARLAAVWSVLIPELKHLFIIAIIPKTPVVYGMIRLPGCSDEKRSVSGARLSEADRIFYFIKGRHKLK